MTNKPSFNPQTTAAAAMASVGPASGPPMLSADDPAFLTERALARRWHVSVRTLQRRRTAGTVPAHIVLGRRILYPLASVLAFEEALLRREAPR